MLLLHGTPVPADDLRPLVDALVPAYRVLVPDLPGYGNSAAPADASVNRIGDALAAMLAQHEISRLRAIVGFSAGAYRALDLVLRHELQVDLIVSLAGFAALEPSVAAGRQALAARLRGEPGFLATDEGRQLVCAMGLSASWAAAHPNDAETVSAWPTATTAPALAAELDALVAARDLRPELAALRCPVYARVGTADLSCPPASSEDLVRHVPRGELELVPGVGHALLIEDQLATVEAVRQRVVAAGEARG